ncbi:hypothetical protein D3C84_1229990 [compost metagenome]|jgi:hypothetical protein
MFDTENKLVAIEQAVAALLSEAKAAGVDLAKLADSAKAGVMGNKMYTFVGSPERKVASCEAIDYLLRNVK